MVKDFPFQDLMRQTIIREVKKPHNVGIQQTSFRSEMSYVRKLKDSANETVHAIGVPCTCNVL